MESDKIYDNTRAITCTKNYILTLIVRGYRETEPQINADESRLIDLDYPPTAMSRLKIAALQHGDEPLPSTRLTLGVSIRVNPRHPRNPHSIVLILAQNQLTGRYLRLSGSSAFFFMM